MPFWLTQNCFNVDVWACVVRNIMVPSNYRGFNLLIHQIFLCAALLVIKCPNSLDPPPATNVWVYCVLCLVQINLLGRLVNKAFINHTFNCRRPNRNHGSHISVFQLTFCEHSLKNSQVSIFQPAVPSPMFCPHKVWVCWDQALVRWVCPNGANFEREKPNFCKHC